MRIDITTAFETSHVERYSTKITARIINDQGVVLCEAEDIDAWPDPNERRATAKAATKYVLEKFERLLSNARDVAKKSGLL